MERYRAIIPDFDAFLATLERPQPVTVRGEPIESNDRASRRGIETARVHRHTVAVERMAIARGRRRKRRQDAGALARLVLCAGSEGGDSGDGFRPAAGRTHLRPLRRTGWDELNGAG